MEMGPEEDQPYQWAFDMTLNEKTGKYELDIPMIGGAHYYYLVVTFSDGSTSEIDDPANPSPCRDNEINSDSETSDITHSIVYGKWDEEEQSNTPNLDFMTPYEGANKGTNIREPFQIIRILVFICQQDMIQTEQNHTKFIYLSHGLGGNETYWFSQPQAVNVMDHVIAENPEQEAIIVGLDNTLYNWDYEQIGENVVNYVIPYMEAHYNVSKNPEDRAFAGFSMGAMTTTYMTFHHADSFGYFGIFSGCNIGNATFKEEFEYDGAKLREEGAEAYL